MKSIAVFCGSSAGSKPIYIEAARDLGSFLTTRGIRIVYGGAKVGLMGALAETAMKEGGEVVGVLPNFLKKREIRIEGLTEFIEVDTMHDRKRVMFEMSDGIIALPGGYGTLDEVFEVVTWAQLGLHQKPIGLLNIDGYYDSLLKFLDHILEEGFIDDHGRETFISAKDSESLLMAMSEFKAYPVPKWMESDQI